MATTGSFLAYAVSDYKGSSSARYRYGLKGEVEVISTSNGKSKVQLDAYFITYNTVWQSSKSYTLTLDGNSSTETAPAIDLSGGGSLVQTKIGSKTVEVTHNSSGKVAFSAAIVYPVSVEIIWADDEYGSTYTLSQASGSFSLDSLISDPTFGSNALTITDITDSTAKASASFTDGSDSSNIQGWIDIYQGSAASGTIVSTITGTKGNTSASGTYSNLVPGVKYTARARAKNSTNTTVYSNTVTFIMECYEPGLVLMVEITGEYESENPSAGNRVDLNTTSKTTVSWTAPAAWGSFDKIPSSYGVAKLYKVILKRVSDGKTYIEEELVPADTVFLEYEFDEDIEVFDSIIATVEPYFIHKADLDDDYHSPGETVSEPRYIYYDKFIYLKPSGSSVYSLRVAWYKKSGGAFTPLKRKDFNLKSSGSSSFSNFYRI